MMKNLKKIAVCMLALAIVIAALPLAAIPTQAAAAEGNPLRLWYDEPASQGTNILGAGANYSDADGSNTWQQQTLPIGNGDMGANVYGEIVSEHLTFNEKTLWTGGPSASRPNYKGGNIEANGNNGKVMEEIQNLFLQGQTSAAVAKCNQLVGAQDGYGSYQPWGDIYFDYKNLSTSGVTNYQRDLSLDTAISTVSFTQGGTDYYREFFISHDDNVLVGRLTAEGAAKLNLDIRFVSKQNGTTVVEGNNTLKLAGQVSDNQLKYSSYLTVVTEGGSVTGSGSKLTVTDADAITVYVSAATDYKNTFWNADKTDDYYYRTGETADQLNTRVKADVDAAVASGYTAVKASHLADYQEMFNRVVLDLGQTVSAKTTDQLLATYKAGTASAAEQRQLEVILFQYGRYLTIASSREDSQLPSNLQGVWNTLNNPPWASDYHMNVNLQMNYWPTYSTNLAECALPLIDYIDSLREPGRITAQIYNGASVGFSAHTQNTPFGWTCPGWAFSWGWSPAAVPWILQNCWEYFEYTGDVEFMEEYLYPMMKEEAQFYDEILIEDNDGKLVSAPAYSPEHGPYTLGNTYEQSLVWQLYEDTVTAAELLGKDADLVAQWKANQANLKGPIEIGDDGQLKEWYEETTLDSMKSQGADPAGHRHLSHMLGLFPGDLVQQKEEWVAAAKVYMDYRTDNSTGWGMGQRINTWARLGEGDKAHELIQNLFKGGIYPNLWDAHTPFQIDGNFGMTSGVAEMLVQSNMGYINLLPALPAVWAEGTVDGLVARGNFEISMDWSKGVVTEATITSNNGGEAVVAATNINLATVTDSKGNAVDTKLEDGKLSFATTKGETYTLVLDEIAVALEAGETAEYVDLTGLYADMDTSALNTKVATVEITNEVTSTETVLAKSVTAIESGKSYVLYNKVSNKLMNNTWADASVGGGGTDGLALSSGANNIQTNDFWTITSTTGGYHVQDVDGKYLSVARGKATLKAEPVVIALAHDGTDWTIGENGEYLNDFGGKHTVVAGWSDINDTNSQWYIYETTTVEKGTSKITFTAVGEGEAEIRIGSILYKITVSPEDTKPEDTKPEDTKPEDTKPEDTKPEDTKPEDTKPEDTKPEDTKPDETTPEETKPEDEKPTVPECDKDDNCVLSEFADIDVNEWYHDGIHFCVDEGIMNGMGEGKFAPTENTTRAQLVTMLYRLAGEPSVEGKEEPFTDVSSDDWFYASIVWAYENKVVNGVTATEFAPNANVTREQVATILHRYLGAPEGTGDLSAFPDAADVSEYAVAPMTWAVGEGLINGIAQADGTSLLTPAGNATRAQIATILMRHLTK